MGQFWYVVATFLAGIAFFWFVGFCIGTAFLLKSGWVPSVQAYPRTTRWFCLASSLTFGGVLLFVFVKIGWPIYKGYFAIVAIIISAWGFLSRIERRFLWNEFFTLSFWLPESITRVMAKDGM
jgi:hypothetical protein